MKGLDTNLLVRYMVQDEPRQSELAARFVEGECTADEPGFVSHIVLCELAWVLDGAYRYPKNLIARVLEQLLRVVQLRVEDPQTVWRALADFRTHGADFADHLIARTHLAHGCEYTATFDKAAAQQAPGFTLLE